MGKNFKQTLKKDQRGVVSIVVAVILMLVMSLIVLAMSENTRREQRQTLDRQLSDQAFYNAESGINDAVAYIYAHPETAIEKKDCGDLGAPANKNIDGAAGVNKYSCVKYDRAPESILYSELSTTAPKVIPITPISKSTGNPIPLANLTISWDDSAARNGNISGDCNFGSGDVKLPQSCEYGGVRVEIIGATSVDPGIDDREELTNNTIISYLLPHEGTGENVARGDFDTYPNNHGIIKASNCLDSAASTASPSTRRCTNTIKDINRQETFYVTVRSLYRPVNLSITGTDAVGGTIRFKNTQTMVDSTGKANDILRRVQVRVPARSEVDYPGFSLQTKDSICKVFEVSKPNSGPPKAEQTDNNNDCKLLTP